MHSKYRIVFIISFLLIFLSVSMSFINYTVALKATQKQLQERSLPLTVDNIYTAIQKHIIEPNLVSSMMAHDTFLKDNENFKKFFILAQRNHSALSLLFLDIDDFKKINDKHGHLVGDKVLERFSVILKEAIRQTDIVARWGGEEFIIVFVSATIEFK